MAKLKQLSLPGYRLLFHVAEFAWKTEHFNIEPNDRSSKIKVQFMRCTANYLAFVPKHPPTPPKNWNPLPKADVDNLLKQIMEHRTELKEEWDETIRQQWPDGFTRNS